MAGQIFTSSVVMDGRSNKSVFENQTAPTSQLSSHIPFGKLESTAKCHFLNKNVQLSRCIWRKYNTHRNVTRGRRRGKCEGAWGRTTRVECELQDAVGHENVVKHKISFEKTFSRWLLEMDEGQDAAPEDGSEFDGIDIYQNREDEGRERSLGLVAIAALKQEQESFFGFKTK